ncbi:MAG TPA: rod shape-determining protein MreD [Alphaproteobacteria bacterium]
MAVVPFHVRAIPAILITLLFAALSLMQSYPLSGSLTLQILFILHPLYYWCVFKPSLFPAWLAFLLGFAIDVYVGQLLGLNAFLLVFVSLVIAKQQRYLRSQPFATQWAGFMLVCIGTEALRWLVMSMALMTLFPVVSPLISALCNAALYPVTVLVMGPALKLISGRSNYEKLHD